MSQVVISGPGLWTPENSISNEELVAAIISTLKIITKNIQMKLSRAINRKNPFPVQTLLKKPAV